MKKAFDQTIRDLKRGVNKKVLKVPSVEQKVLDATSNEPWGPHGSLLADIAQATRNYHEYQMIMAVIWKRLSDTGKNWRHVYKALTVLEYLVAHGSERVIDEIKEHAYQISTLSDFQYMDSSGRDQGNNVRRKSQTLVVLVNDKEKIQEVREKAASNRDKFRSTSIAGGMYRPGSYSGCGEDRYESQYDERNGNSRERDREGGYRDDEMYGQYGDSYSREGDRYGRESDEHYRKERFGDDDSWGRPQSVDGRGSDRDGDHDDDRHSARGSSIRGENQVDGRPIERKDSEQNLGMPPSYEEAVGVSQSPTYTDRDGEIPPSLAPQSSSPVPDATPPLSFPNGSNPSQVTLEHDFPSHPNLESDGFDEFNPRAAFPGPPVPTTSNAGEMDLLGSLSDAFIPGPPVIMPASNTSDIQPDTGSTASHSSFTAVSGNNFSSQPFEDPFGDSPFKAIPSDVAPSQPQNFTPPPSFNPSTIPSEHSQPTTQKAEPPNIEFSDTFAGLSFHPSTPNLQTPQNQPNVAHDDDDDILAGILPPSAPLHRAASVGAFPPSQSQVGHGFTTQVGPTSTPFSQTPSHSFSFSAPSAPLNPPHLTDKGLGVALSHQNSDLMGDVFSRPHLPSSNSTGSLSLVLLEQQPAKEKFEPKSAVWADTLSRGLVNLNISGPKINPLSDIGIDFDSLNRKEKRMEKPSATPTTSNITMGKAMGSGSGMGRASVGGMRPPPNPMMGSGMSMGGPGAGIGMGGYGSMNQQPMGISMGMGMNNMNMGMGMTPNGSDQGPNMNYNPMMGRGGYPQPPYGGGYGGGYRSS